MTKTPEDYKDVLNGLVQLFTNPEVQVVINKLQDELSNNNSVISGGRLYYKGYYAQLHIDLVKMNIYCAIEETNDFSFFFFNVETVKEANQHFKNIIDSHLAAPHPHLPH